MLSSHLSGWSEARISWAVKETCLQVFILVVVDHSFDLHTFISGHWVRQAQVYEERFPRTHVIRFSYTETCQTSCCLVMYAKTRDNLIMLSLPRQTTGGQTSTNRAVYLSQVRHWRLESPTEWYCLEERCPLEIQPACNKCMKSHSQHRLLQNYLYTRCVYMHSFSSIWINTYSDISVYMNLKFCNPINIFV